MKRLAAIAASGILLSHALAQAAEIRLLSSVGVRPVLEELLPRFERASGHQVVVQFGTAVVGGEVEVGVGLASEIVAVRGVQAVPLMPQDASSYVGFAGVAASATDRADAARALLEFLTSPAARDVFRARGMLPG